MKRGEHSPEATKRRKQQQRKYRRYMELRDELQTSGVIPVEPSGAKRSERVDPATQSEQKLPELIPQAIRKGWAVPEEKKPALVDEMVAIVDDREESNKVKVAAFNALRMADRSQWEQENPVEAGKAKGGASTVAVSIQSNMLAVQVLREAMERDEGRGNTLLPAPTESVAPGNRRFDGEVEAGAASTSDQPDFGGSVAYPEQSDINYSTLPAREEPSV